MIEVFGQSSKQCCYLCGSEQNITRPGSVRDNSSIKILECADCGLVYLSSFSHITEDHYERSGMHQGEMPAITEWLDETQFDDERRYQFIEKLVENKSILDFGCGIGGFLERAKETASKAAGIELEEALQSSFNERGLCVFPNLKAAFSDGNKWDLITAFHVVEHLVDPKGTLKELSMLLEDDGEIIVEVPNSEDALLTLYENESFQRFTYWSQHLFLFNTETLTEVARQAGMKVNWIKHIQRYPLSNHLYWLANGKPGGHQEWNFLNNTNLNYEYENQLAILGKTDTIIGSLSKV